MKREKSRFSERTTAMGKLLFIDVDGTLVDYETNLPSSAVTAIRTARANGHRVYLCTGRSEAEIYDNIRAIGFDGMLGGNGAYVRDEETIVMHHMITYEQCIHIVDWCHGRRLEFYLESNNGLFASENFETRGIPVLQEYSRRKGNAIPLSVKDIFPEMIYGGELYRSDVNKVSFILNSYQDHLDSVDEFPDLKPGVWGGAGETALFGDLGIKDISKKHAVDVLLSYLGRTKEDTIAFGDASVDIPMFEACGYSVAMGSGGEECKKAADYITDDVDKDGLYNAFIQLGLI